MPFDSNFIQQRNQYLQQSIKNQNYVSNQFYPRFVQAYNNSVPFTEGTLNESPTIYHPTGSNTIIKSYLKPEDLQTAKDNLNLKLTQITGNDDISNYIIKNLKPEEVKYYNEHFSEVQNHLLKIIHLPSSKETFLSNLKQLLANEPHSKNIGVIATSMMPQPPQPPPGYARGLIDLPLRSVAQFTQPKQLLDNKPFYITPIKRKLRSRLANLGKDSDSVAQDSDSVVSSSASSFSKKGVKPGTKRGPYRKGLFALTGKGLKRQIQQKVEFKKYAIDLKKLSKNILALKYLKSGNNIPTFKPIEISDTLKQIIEQLSEQSVLCTDDEVAKLSQSEKRIFSRLMKQIGIKSNLDCDDEFIKDFEICYGSFSAGNDSIVLKNKLKEYVKIAIHEGIITPSKGQDILSQL